MKKIGQFWVPDVDATPGDNLTKSQHGFANGAGPQIAHLLRALELVPGRTLAIDGGANVGAWTSVMAKEFGVVHSFEPSKEAFACLARNVEEWALGPHVAVHHKALSNRHEFVSIGTREGARTVTGRIIGAGDIEAITLDSLGLPYCSFLKLDLEGHEEAALKGAAKTIKTFGPWILIENKPRLLERITGGTKADKYLRKLGYRLVEKIGDKQIDWLYKPAG